MAESRIAERFAPFEPDSAAGKAVAAGRRRNAEMSAIDGEAGFAAPEACDLPLQLRTAISALCAALETEAEPRESAAWEMVAEAVGLLQDAELRLRTDLELAARLRVTNILRGKEGARQEK